MAEAELYKLMADIEQLMVEVKHNEVVLLPMSEPELEETLTSPFSDVGRCDSLLP
jgi:hypothetical protein